MTVLALVAALGLLVANGYFVAYEFAVVGARPTQFEADAAAGDRRSAGALAATRSVNRQLSGAQLGITMASLGLGAVAEPALAGLVAGALGGLGLEDAPAHAIAVALALAVVVFLHMVVGEMVPKSIALTAPERTLRALVPINRAYLVVVGWFVTGLTAIGDLGVRLLGIEPQHELMSAHTAEQLSRMLATSRREGVIEDAAADLMTGVLDFGDLTAEEVMTPRRDLSFVGRTSTVAEVETVVVESGHSRLPVVGQDLDDVRGFVHAKDLLALEPSAADRPLPLRLVRRMLVVPPDRGLDDLLRSMRATRVHVALVVDELGRTRGLVTLEDLLEELVGDILDESDR